MTIVPDSGTGELAGISGTPRSTTARESMTLVRRAVPVSCLLALLPALGCQEAPERGQRLGAGVDAVAVDVADSGGVSIARIPNLHALDLPELSLTLLHSTVGDLDLVEVVGAVLLPDSSLVIADKVAPNLSFLRPDGIYGRRWVERERVRASTLSLYRRP